ncbi:MULTISPECIES: AbrB family transcriptional regulator [Mesorhizobium]|uniref:AbrB family transcriptional regulator n=1 Tax=Mesorhizobium denitrificans TaxID=2294114 RepID=A0A371XJH7_9HYPH|nr:MULTISPECIES: AbrB family transcriptional regulator [Mesorhizobium]RFC69375.1 hypothetical protein DY251_01135 [Mesorhizobium denitrificans]
MSALWYRSNTAVVVLTLVAASGTGYLFRTLHMPMAYILGSMVGAALVANLIAPMPGGKKMRRFSQLFVGASVGAVMNTQVLEAIYGLFPMMLMMAVAANLIGVALVLPLSRLAHLDRVTALMSCLPAGMAEMATLAHEVKADEQSVAIIHTLRVLTVLTMVPLWLILTGHPISNRISATTTLTMHDAVFLALLILASLLIAVVATRMRVINAFVVVPTLMSVALVAFGLRIPTLPSAIIIAAQIGIGASIGLRFRFDRMRKLPRTVIGGLIASIVLVSTSIFGLGYLIETYGGMDHLSALLSAAPGGLAEMIATADALGVAAALVAAFQLTRSVFTNIVIAPIVRWVVTPKV